MSANKLRFHDGRMGSALAIRVSRFSDSDEIEKILDDGTLLIQLRVLDDERSINDELKLYLARVLDVPLKKIEIIAGEDGRDKLVAILDIGVEEIQKRITEYL